MKSRPLQIAGLALSSAVANLVVAPAALAVDATFLAAPYKNGDGKDAAPYDVEYAAAAIELRASPNTPEADALPGEYFFMQGARAFMKKEYAFAVQMYQAAASWAYKPAEYNLGVMYARGQGVAVDLPRALAWMALAAERNEQHYIDAREAVYAEMSKEQFDQANVIWRELKQDYGDAVALRRAKARWAEVRAGSTGSHVGAVGNLVVTAPSGGQGNVSNPNNPAYHRPLEEHVARGAPNPRFKGNTFDNSGAFSGAEVAQGRGEDGSIAYRDLHLSDDPYDPKFRKAIGTAQVGPVKQIKDGKAADEPAGDADADRHHPR